MVAWDFFRFYSDIELFVKIKKTWFLHTRFLLFFSNSKSKQNKKNPEHPLVHIVKWETCAKFQQKILNSMVVVVRQSFQLFRQITLFLENNRTLSKFR